MKKPKSKEITIDLKICKTISMATNANKRYYSCNEQIFLTKAAKYTSIIRNFFKVGRGLKKLDISDIEYVYWDDPHELVDRLRLLMVSQLAGYNNFNEIIAIIEALQGADISE